MAYRQWGLRGGAGRRSLLNLGVAGEAKQMVLGSGELGYQGEGYLVGRRGERLVVASAVVGPDGIAARGTDHLPRTLWEVLRGTASPYYMVRVAMPEAAWTAQGEAAAIGLLARLLPVLQMQLSATAR